MRHNTLIVSGHTTKKLITMTAALAIVEKAFKSHARKQTQMPAKIYLHLEKCNGDFRAMPAYIDGMRTCGIKWVNVHPHNKKHGLPSVMALIILNDICTGKPLAIMDGTYITSLRTGAAGGIAGRYLARKDSSTAGFVGSGVQALYQFLALAEYFRFREVSVYDINTKHRAAFIKAIQRPGLSVRPCDSVAECVMHKDIVVTTTPAKKPIVRAEWISPGTHINAIGADAKGKEELSSDLLKRSRIFVDDKVQAIHSGEINVPITKKVILPSAISATIGEVIIGTSRGRLSAKDITIFDSTGLAILDIAVADHIYQRLRSRRKNDVYRFQF